MNILCSSCFALTTIITFLAWLPLQDPWSGADSATIRLPPSRFRVLPPIIIRDLERRTCRVPQVSRDLIDSLLVNVVRGAFIVPGRRDWAVLCSIRDSSRVLIYRDDFANPIDSIAKGADRNSLQGIGVNRIGYSRLISTAGLDRLGQVATRNTVTMLPHFDHDGIEDHFVGKVSVIRYFHRGRWLRLLGAD